MTRSTRLVIQIKNIPTLGGWKRCLLPFLPHLMASGANWGEIE